MSVLITTVVLYGCNQDGKENKENPYGKGTDEYRLFEAIAAHDTAIHMMGETWMRDPYIYAGPDGYYYLSCTRNRYITGGVEGLEYWRSRDLVSWDSLGVPWTIRDSEWMHILQERADLEGKILRTWAPEVYYFDGRWVVVHTTSIGGSSNLLLTTGETLDGPYTEPMDSLFGRRHDPSIFTDDDGSRWLVYKNAFIHRLKPDFSGFEGEEVRLDPSDRRIGHEGCMIHKLGDRYVLFGTGWSADQMRHGTYNLYYCTAEKLTGPYGPRKFAGRFLGHGTLFKDLQGRWWCTAFYNANKPPVDREVAQEMDMSGTAYTINRQGLTLVPMEFRLNKGELEVYPRDPAYQEPGAEEAQEFNLEQ